ncbi:MAG TPA: hypothetical protein VF845_13910, partial [Terriglobales bacterium]
MKVPVFLFVDSMRRYFASSFWIFALLLATAMGMNPGLLRAQENAATPDPQTLQRLLERIDQLEARVRQLEAARAQPSVASSAEPQQKPAPPAPISSEAAQANSAPEHEADPTEHAEAERMDLSKTLLRIRGFGDVTLHGDNQKGDTTSFSLGQLNLFVTSDISDKFKFLSEIVFEGGPDNFYGEPEGTRNLFTVDVERYLVQYSHNDYFNLAAGRYHTAIG